MTAALPNGPAAAALISLVAAALLAAHERGGVRRLMAVPSLLALAPMAAAIGLAPRAEAAWPALIVALVIATLSRGRDVLQSECAIKLLWVMGGCLALSAVGEHLLVIVTGTPIADEQWAVLAMGLDPRPLWSAAIPLTMLTGMVLLGGAPFHFWAADLFQGARPWLAPLAVAALQGLGAAALASRLEGIERFAAGAALTDALLGLAALIAFAAGTVTLIAQRRPERRIGTLASLNGALLIAALATHRGGRTQQDLNPEDIGMWVAHLALALSGAGTLSRFVPVSSATIGPAPVLFRRHPWSGSLGLFALFSLAGVPGTPGSHLWLAVAKDLAASGRVWLLVALAAAWLAAFAVAVKQMREAFGVRVETAPPEADVPWQARAALWLTGGALVAWVVVEWAGR